MRPIHFIWIQGPPPEKYLPNLMRYKKLNPYPSQVIIWNGEQIRELMGDRERQIFDSLPTYVQKADYGRVTILDKCGGVYLDMDMEPRRQIPGWLWEEAKTKVIYSETGAGFLSGRRSAFIVTNAFVAGPPQHPFYGAVKELMTGRLLGNHYSFGDALHTTGPWIYTRAYQLLKGAGISLLRYELFEPAMFLGGYFNPFRVTGFPEPPSDRTIASHRRDASWRHPWMRLACRGSSAFFIAAIGGAVVFPRFFLLLTALFCFSAVVVALVPLPFTYVRILDRDGRHVRYVKGKEE